MLKDFLKVLEVFLPKRQATKMQDNDPEHVAKRQKLNSAENYEAAVGEDEILVESAHAVKEEGFSATASLTSSALPLVEVESVVEVAEVAAENVKFSLKVESGKNSVKKQVAKVLEKAGVTR